MERGTWSRETERGYIEAKDWRKERGRQEELDILARLKSSRSRQRALQVEIKL